MRRPVERAADRAADELRDLERRAVSIELGKRGVERYGFNLNPEFGTSVPGDLGGYEPLKVPRVQAIHSGPMYHTSGDVLESISVPGLERAARFYTFFVTEVAKATRSGIDPGGSRARPSDRAPVKFQI